MILKKYLLTAVVALGLTACATSGPPSEYDQLVQQAENEIKIAKQMETLWKDTEKFLKASKTAQKAGDMDKAMKLAKKALRQAQMAQQQAKDNANLKLHY